MDSEKVKWIVKALLCMGCIQMGMHEHPFLGFMLFTLTLFYF